MKDLSTTVIASSEVVNASSTYVEAKCASTVNRHWCYKEQRLNLFSSDQVGASTWTTPAPSNLTLWSLLLSIVRNQDGREANYSKGKITKTFLAGDKHGYNELFFVGFVLLYCSTSGSFWNGALSYTGVQPAVRDVNHRSVWFLL